MGLVSIRMTQVDLAGLVEELTTTRTLCEKAGATAAAARNAYYIDLLSSPLHVTTDDGRSPR